MRRPVHARSRWDTDRVTRSLAVVGVMAVALLLASADTPVRGAFSALILLVAPGAAAAWLFRENPMADVGRHRRCRHPGGERRRGPDHDRRRRVVAARRCRGGRGRQRRSPRLRAHAAGGDGASGGRPRRGRDRSADPWPLRLRTWFRRRGRARCGSRWSARWSWGRASASSGTRCSVAFPTSATRSWRRRSRSPSAGSTTTPGSPCSRGAPMSSASSRSNGTGSASADRSRQDSPTARDSSTSPGWSWSWTPRSSCGDAASRSSSSTTWSRGRRPSSPTRPRGPHPRSST